MVTMVIDGNTVKVFNDRVEIEFDRNHQRHTIELHMSREEKLSFATALKETAPARR